MCYLTTSEAMRINEVEIGQDLLADLGLLEAAVLRPQQTIFGSDAYPDIHTKAAAMLHSLIRNHPFIDGNKRTAVLSMIVFYNLNGHALELEIDQGQLVALAIDVAERQIDVEAIAGILKGWIRPFRLPDD